MKSSTDILLHLSETILSSLFSNAYGKKLNDFLVLQLMLDDFDYVIIS